MTAWSTTAKAHGTQRSSQARIRTLDSLREHLQWAIELEPATLPPYLCALYSLDPARNPEAVVVVWSVFVEEMLHARPLPPESGSERLFGRPKTALGR
jgi:Ferritin-like